MKKLDLRNKIWIYASVMFMGALLVVTLSVIGSYSYRLKKLGANVPPQTTVPKTDTTSPKGGIDIDIEDEKDRTINSLLEKNNALKSEVSSLKARPQGANVEPYINLMQADDFARRGDYITAFDIILKLRENPFQGYAQEKYTNLKGYVKARVSRQFYDQGMRAYRKRDYKSAADFLSKATLYGDEQVFVDDAAYYAALSFNGMGDTASAKRYFELLFGNYPKSSFIAAARKIYITL